MLTDEQRHELSDMPYWDDYLCYPQPCWHNISPGKTTLDEAIAIIQADPTLELFHADVPNGRIFMWERTSNPQAGGMISYTIPKDKELALIGSLYVSEAPEHELCLKDAISIYGNPIFVSYVISRHGGIFVDFSGNVIARIYDNLNPTSRDVFPNSSITQLIYSDSVGEVPDKQLWTGYSDTDSSQQTK